MYREWDDWCRIATIGSATCAAETADPMRTTRVNPAAAAVCNKQHPVRFPPLGAAIQLIMNNFTLPTRPPPSPLPSLAAALILQ